MAKPQHRHVAPLLVAGLTLLLVHAATGQTKRSDSEMKEVLRLLLEREVQADIFICYEQTYIGAR